MAFLMKQKNVISRYGDNQKGYFDIKLSNNQMRKICNNLSQIAYNSISENIVDTNELM